jgi:MFS family permease
MYLTDRPRQNSAVRTTVKRRVAGTVVLAGVVSMFTDISSESVSAILPLYLTAVVGLGPLAYGFIDGIYQGVSALVRILAGWFSDRVDHPKWVACFGYGLSAVTRIALIPLHGFAAITGVITIDRLGKGIRTAPRDALIVASSEPESLGYAFGVHRAMDTLGAIIGPLLAFFLLSAVSGNSRTAEDFRPIFVASFAAAVIGFAVLVLFVPDLRPRRASATARAAEARQRIRPAAASLKLLADRRFALLIAAAGVLGVLTVGDGFLYLGLQRRDNLAVEYFPLLYVGTNLAYFAMAVPFGRIADRVGRAKIFLLGHVALILAYFCAGGPFAGAGVVLVCLLLLGTYYAATDGVLAALAGGIVEPAALTSGIATAQTVQAVARLFSSTLFGVSWSLFGPRTAFGVVGVLLVVVLPIGWLTLGRTDMRPVTDRRRTS